MLLQKYNIISNIVHYIRKKYLNPQPLRQITHRDKLYNVAAAIHNGELLGLIPKKYIPNYSEFYEARHFHGGPAETADIFVDGMLVPFGQNLIFTCEELGMTLAAEICERFLPYFDINN